MATYFGNPSGAESGYTGCGSQMRWPHIDEATIATMFTCPGTGAQTLVELGMKTKDANGNVRVAIYTAATPGVLIAQGSAEIAGVADTWITHTSFTNLAGNPVTPSLTGGTVYILAITGDGTVNFIYTTVTNGYAFVKTTADYTGGFPENTPTEGNSTALPLVRAGVESASSGISVIAGTLTRRRRV